MKNLAPLKIGKAEIPVQRCGVLVIGSGAASLAAADRLSAFAAQAEPSLAGTGNIASDTVIATESLSGGTSRNTGSDKQTYYRLSMAERAGDSPFEMAEALHSGGCVHGDIALAEAIGSAEAFYHLVSIGLAFPMNEAGGFVGYKTDHDPRKRGTSIGPYTSKSMVERLLAEVRTRGVPILEGHHAVALLASPSTADERPGRVFGAFFIDENKTAEASLGLKLIVADAVVFGVGGPGGLYASSVYPEVHSGAIGLAVEIGAACANLTESQFGLASKGFRWNVSGTYQQVVPRYVSIGPDGDEEEFLTPFFESPGKRDSAVFLKGYQWPFDPRKVASGGSSLVDLLVHRERLQRGRRVYMDFTRNPSAWNPEALSEEARSYLERSGALAGLPIDRLSTMNPLAVEHYRTHGIDLSKDLLEVAVSAQHNNGGLAADEWWESVNIDRLFPVGEVNGSHGIYRPGGAALNAGQVGALRAARKILGSYARPDLRDEDWRQAAIARAAGLLSSVEIALSGGERSIGDYRTEFQERMDRFGGILRSASEARNAASEALSQVRSFASVKLGSSRELVPFFRVRQLVLAHAAYLEAVAAYVEAGGGSRGSVLVTGSQGRALHPKLSDAWKALEENKELSRSLQELRFSGSSFSTRWEPCRPIPEGDDWFENVWRAFREGAIYKGRRPLSSP
ncbi:FAD-binding protein [Treponema sp.]